MKKHRQIYTAAAVIAAVGIGVAGSVSAQGTLEKCTQDFARSSIAAGTPDVLCGCTAITRGAVSYIQRRDDFVDLLEGYEASCVGFANVLGDLPTASIGGLGRGVGGSDERVLPDAPAAVTATSIEPTDDDDEDPKGKKDKKKKKKRGDHDHHGDKGRDHDKDRDWDRGKDRDKDRDGKGNASANNGKGGNYPWTGMTDNGKGKGRDKGRKPD